MTTMRKTTQGAMKKGVANGTGRAVFARFGGPPDADGDITEPGAFTDGQVVPMSAYNHGSWNPGMLPIGKGVIRVEHDRAVFDFELFTDTTAGAEAYSVLKRMGNLVEFSYGFEILDTEPGQWQGQRVRVLKKLKTFEVSPVLVGAGRDTELVTLKGHRSGRPSRAQRAEMQAIKDRLEQRQLLDMKDRLQQEMYRTELADLYDSYVQKIGVPYSEDLASLVHPDVRRAAWAAVGAYSPELGLDREAIKIRWFSAEDDGDEFTSFWSEIPLLGRCLPKAAPTTIWLNSGLTDDDSDGPGVWDVCAHELHHLAGGSEEEARLYESRARLLRMGLIAPDDNNKELSDE